MEGKVNKNIILIHTNTVDQFKNLFNEKARDNCTEPFIRLKKQLNKLDYSIKYANKQSLDNVKNVIFWDNSHIYKGFNPLRFIRYLKNYNWIRKAKNKSNTVLIIWEGRALGDYRFNEKYHRGFDKILTWNDSLVDNNRYFKFYLPIPENWPVVEKLPFNKKKLLVNISYNKSSRQTYELYSKRLESIRYFDKYYSNDFDIFGFGWDSKMYSTYKGTVENKYEILPFYKFGLCYENIEGEKGQVTEKIFDCMRSNCVPIYWGASNINDFVDKDAFIDRRNFKSNKELADYLNNITEKKYNAYLAKIDSYLETPNFKRFLSSSFVDNIIYHLDI
jgi:alpha(1,3/1,4) fucosyltransferase